MLLFETNVFISFLKTLILPHPINFYLINHSDISEQVGILQCTRQQELQ